MSLKAIASGILGLSFVVGLAQTGQQPIRVVIDGNAMVFNDQQPTKSNNRVLVPLRGIFERLGAEVRWDPATQSVTARRGRRTIKLSIGLLDASIDGRDVHLDVPATLVGGSTMVPLRFVSESLGASVKWNDQDQEADITSPPQEYVPPIRVATPPPVRIIQRPPTMWDVIEADSVLPFRLNTRLSSYNARPGDQFTANIMTMGARRYMGIPDGTIAYGHVTYATPRRGDRPGILELHFDRITTPTGNSFPVDGRLIDLQDGRIAHGPHGELMARGTDRDDRAAFTGVGIGVGLIVGVHDRHPIADAALGGLLGAALGSRRPDRHSASDVQLVPGTQLGLRLHRNIQFRHDIR